MATRRAAADGQETELKLLAEPEVLARLCHSRLIRRITEDKPVTRRLVSVYYDTPDLALRSKGIALRVRESAGTYRQVVKSEDTKDRAVSCRAEAEAALPDARPDPALIPDDGLRRFVTKAAERSGLRPVFETDVRRTMRRLVTGQGDKVELAIDAGVIRAGGREEQVSELELELISGNPSALFRIARPLSETHDLRLGVLSKAARGYALATGESGISPVKARSAKLRASMTTEAACRAILGTCLSQIIANEPAVSATRDPEAVHQMRVGLRRFRSAVDGFAQAGLHPWLSSLADEARWLAARLGAARDLDVYLDEMLPPVERQIPDHAGLRRLRKAAGKRRKRAWKRGRSAVGAARFTTFVLRTEEVLATRPWHSAAAGEDGACIAGLLATPARDFARRVLEERLDHVRKKARSFDSMTTGERHKLRKELKKLRYTADAFAGFYARESVKPFLKALATLQDAFGYLNDLAVAERLSRKLAKSAGNGGKAMLREATGLVVGWHSHAASEEWKLVGKRWKSLAKIQPFWR